ncbi:hypothetical protein MLD63_12445 [Paracoccus sp. TK19116]|uniref:Capsular polysaccharide transport system permease protein n=1 Tax=Paracoccus albicereus TaxID=2922394 RepID=A0ABT1MSS5_9RHOB|nr:hypothetical protein [Paracoccus albicereus]MCQ0971231.1 hypothetical protein [Paracoccus albicereus]
MAGPTPTPNAASPRDVQPQQDRDNGGATPAENQRPAFLNKPRIAATSESEGAAGRTRATPAQAASSNVAPRQAGPAAQAARAAQPGVANRPAPAQPGRPGAPAKPRPPGAAQVAHAPVAPPASRARLGLRHIGVALSFLILVLIPVLVAAWYLYQRAADQYASYLGFSVRSESAPAAAELLGGLGEMAGLGNSSGSDTDILYKYIQSHELVQRIDQQLDLRAIWSKPKNDPIFSYRGDSSLEDLIDAWEDKVRVYYDNGMIDLRILAFDPADSQKIGEAILSESSAMINAINDVAREDTIRYSREELDVAEERLRQARSAMTAFRNAHQIVDPTADVAGQAGVLAGLQQQLAEALIQLGVLRSNAQPNDPRIEQSQLRVDVIRQQIDEERLKFGSETTEGEQLSELVGEYEGLVVDREFAERAYLAARASYDSALAEAQRQSRYLAAYVRPTLADRPEYPQKAKLIGILGGFLMLIWIIAVLTYYSMRDRR